MTVSWKDLDREQSAGGAENILESDVSSTSTSLLGNVQVPNRSETSFRSLRHNPRSAYARVYDYDQLHLFQRPMAFAYEAKVSW